MSEQTQSGETEEIDEITRLRSLIPVPSVLMLCSGHASHERRMHSRPLRLLDMRSSGELSFLVDRTAEWVGDLSAGDSVNLSLADAESATWVSVAGTVAIDDERAALVQLVERSTKKDVDSLRSDDPVVLRVTPSSVEYWDSASGTLEALAIAASRLFGMADDERARGSIEFEPEVVSATE